MNKEQAVTYLRFSGFSDEQIKAIEEAFTCDKCVYSTNEGCQYDDITETIPPVTPQLKTDWIPVSERLPKDKQRVLVTRKSGTIGYIMWNTWWHEQTEYPTDKVIAWMPLPEPYKEEVEK